MKIKYPQEIVDFLKSNGSVVNDGINTFYQFPLNWLLKTDIENVFETKLDESQIKTIEKLLPTKNV